MLASPDEPQPKRFSSNAEQPAQKRQLGTPRAGGLLQLIGLGNVAPEFLDVDVNDLAARARS
jgi:hypothetical protein